MVWVIATVWNDMIQGIKFHKQGQRCSDEVEEQTLGEKKCVSSMRVLVLVLR